MQGCRGSQPHRNLKLDCSALLTRQLEELSLLVARLQACKRRGARERLLRELSNVAVLHVLSRERVLLPAWRRARWKDLPYEALAAHVELKRALAELMVSRPHSTSFDAAVAAFAAAVERQVATDRKRLVPALRRAFDVRDRRELFNDIEVLFEAGEPPRANELLIATEAPPRELIEDAEIVLSSLSQALGDGEQAAPA